MTVVAASSYLSAYRAIPYLTVAEYTNAPTGVDLSSLVPGGTAEQQEAELANVILRASSQADGICDQQLASTTLTESARVRATRNGSFRVPTRYWPVREVTAFSYGLIPSELTALTDFSGVWVEERGFEVTTRGVGAVSTNFPLGFGFIPPGMQSFTVFTYTAGWVATTLAAAVVAGATTATLVSVAGVFGSGGPQAPTALTFYDGISTETAVVESLSGSTVTFAAPLLYAHAAGVSTSELPPAVKQAVILLTSQLLTNWGGDVMVMNQVGTTAPKAPKTKGPQRTEAEMLLGPYRRVM